MHGTDFNFLVHKRLGLKTYNEIERVYVNQITSICFMSLQIVKRKISYVFLGCENIYIFLLLKRLYKNNIQAFCKRRLHSLSS